MKYIIWCMLFIILSVSSSLRATRETPPESFTAQQTSQLEQIDGLVSSQREKHGDKRWWLVYGLFVSLYDQYSEDKTMVYMFRHILASLSVLHDSTNEPYIQTYLVSSSTLPCVWTPYDGCLLLKEKIDDDWSFFLDRIYGFDYVPWEYYLIEVLTIPHPRNVPSTHSSLDDYFLIDALPFVSDELDEIYAL